MLLFSLLTKSSVSNLTILRIDDVNGPMGVWAQHHGLLFGEWMLLVGEKGCSNERPRILSHDHPPPFPFIRGGLCCLFNSFICRNDCDYQSRAHCLTEEVKVSPQEDKPQKTISYMICVFIGREVVGKIPVL